MKILEAGSSLWSQFYSILEEWTVTMEPPGQLDSVTFSKKSGGSILTVNWPTVSQPPTPHTLHPSVFPPLVSFFSWVSSPVAQFRIIRLKWNYEAALLSLKMGIFSTCGFFPALLKDLFASAPFLPLFPCTCKETRKKCKAHHSCFCGKKSVPCSFSKNKAVHFLCPWWKSFWSSRLLGFPALGGFGWLTCRKQFT